MSTVMMYCCTVQGATQLHTSHRPGKQAAWCAQGLLLWWLVCFHSTPDHRRASAHTYKCKQKCPNSPDERDVWCAWGWERRCQGTKGQRFSTRSRSLWKGRRVAAVRAVKVQAGDLWIEIMSHDLRRKYKAVLFIDAFLFSRKGDSTVRYIIGIFALVL